MVLNFWPFAAIKSVSIDVIASSKSNLIFRGMVNAALAADGCVYFLYNAD